MVARIVDVCDCCKYIIVSIAFVIRHAAASAADAVD